MVRRLLFFALWLASATARAQSEPPDPVVEEPPRRAISWAPDGKDANPFVPLVEVPALNIGVWGVAKLTGKPYADISFSSMWKNISSGPWVWDDNPYIANQIGHPYQGSLAFASARSSGLNFWLSAPFALYSSVMWELLMETEPPSANDLITTTVGGIVLGEILHRLSLLVLDSGEPTFGRWLAGSLLDPVGSLNHVLFGRRANDFFRHPRYHAQLFVGAASDIHAWTETGGIRVDERTGPQMLFGAEVTSGLPGDRKLELRRPFDHYTASLRFALLHDAWLAMFLRGLLTGGRYETTELTGLWGLFAGYEFASQKTLRVTTVSVGLGTSAQYGRGSFVLLPTLIVSAVPFGAGGSFRPPNGNRDYQYGPGVQAHARLQAVIPGVLRVGAAGTLYRLYGQFVGEGTEAIAHASLTLEVLVGEVGALGIEAVIADRDASFGGLQPETHQRSSLLSVYWTIPSDTRFGAAP